MADAAIHTDRDAENEAAADTAGRNRASETAQEYPRRRLRREQEEAQGFRELSELDAKVLLDDLRPSPYG